MTPRRVGPMAARAAGVALYAAATVLAPIGAQPAQAASAPGLAISVPATASLGSVSPGGSLSTVLGSVTVTTTGLVGQSAAWTATVSAVAFSTGAGGSDLTIPGSAVTYWSGPATASSGLSAQGCTPGQLTAATAVTMSAARTAFSCTGVSILGSTSLTWRPTITVNPGRSAIAGSYSGAITHSVV